MEKEGSQQKNLDLIIRLFLCYIKKRALELLLSPQFQRRKEALQRKVERLGRRTAVQPWGIWHKQSSRVLLQGQCHKILFTSGILHILIVFLRAPDNPILGISNFFLTSMVNLQQVLFCGIVQQNEMRHPRSLCSGQRLQRDYEEEKRKGNLHSKYFICFNTYLRRCTGSRNIIYTCLHVICSHMITKSKILRHICCIFLYILLYWRYCTIHTVQLPTNQCKVPRHKL